MKIEKEGSNNNLGVDFFLDCRIGINTANNKVSTVRDAHVDNTKVLYTGMLYLRDDFDDSSGSSFLIYEPKKPIKIGIGRSVSKSYLNQVKEIPYKGNNMIIFANSSNSIHGVSPRGITPHLRKFIAFNATYKEPLFNLESEEVNFFQKIVNKIKYF